MWWVVAGVLVALCFVAGIVPEDQGMSLARCWDRVRYSVSAPEWILAIVTGVFLVVILYILNGTLRLLTLAVGVLTIITGVLAQRIGEILPPYPRGSGKYKEVEECISE
jgi:hypothetical protein